MGESTASPFCCGKCGYSVRGVAELKCPECQADLREVGIVKTTVKRRAILGCVGVMFCTAVMCFIAVALVPVITSLLPGNYSESFDIELIPKSGQIDSVTLYMRYWVELPVGAQPNSSISVTANQNNQQSTQASFFSITGLNPGTQLTGISLLFHSNVSVNGVRQQNGSIDLHPQSTHANWYNSQMQLRTLSMPLTQQHVLAAMKDAGADITRQDVMDEARAIEQLVHRIMNGTTQHSVSHFDVDNPYSFSSDAGPPWWFSISYLIFWAVIWCATVLVLTRKLFASGQNQPKQIHKKY